MYQGLSESKKKKTQQTNDAENKRDGERGKMLMIFKECLRGMSQKYQIQGILGFVDILKIQPLGLITTSELKDSEYFVQRFRERKRGRESFARSIKEFKITETHMPHGTHTHTHRRTI